MLPKMIEAKKRTKNEVIIKRFKIDNKYNNIVSNKKYFLKTYGCQMNEHESENIRALVEFMGYEKTDEIANADLLILNTCSIRENANNKVFGMLGRIKHLKQSKKDIIVGIMGCMAQEEVIANKILEKYTWLSFVIGTHRIEELCHVIYNSFNDKKIYIDAPSIEGNIIEDLPVKRNSKYKAFVNIMYGCDKFCTYCIVPYTRGKQRSRRPIDILNEVTDLVKNGYLEITLLGQNVNAYGKDLQSDYDFSNLLEDVSKTNIQRVRFITSHPWDFTDDMIEVISKYKNIMPYIHLPIQSGSNKILKLMGRKYTREEYFELYNKIKLKIPNVAISTDIIVGFPNETEADFVDTIDIVEKCKFDLAYTFIFSKRSGTPAYNMVDNTALEEKEERLQRLNELVNKYSYQNNNKLLGKEVLVLIEDYSEKKKNMFCGYTDTNKLVNVKSEKNVIGQIVAVRITGVKTWSLDGEIID